MNLKTISIVIPLYNEEKRIVGTLPQIYEHIDKLAKKLKIKFELIFINDGSTDSTREVVKKIKNLKTRLISYKKNKGKGYALKKGFSKATGDYILFMDADLSTPLKHLEDFIKKIESGETILIGSRKMKGAAVKKHQSFIRENLGKGFTLLSNIFLVWGISDFTCGFKMFPKNAGKAIFSKVTINRWGFDSEIIFIAKKKGYKIKEIPVEWINDNNTKVDLKKDIPRSLKEIFQIRLNHFKKKYG
ncbi:glycosyltransferase family 2 protein [Patescibacteria group bacterium]|nr:glycosyltransferase family 2 protein [Patescibacteria group bacterium]